jgi:uncharacterized membrane protein
MLLLPHICINFAIRSESDSSLDVILCCILMLAPHLAGMLGHSALLCNVQMAAMLRQRVVVLLGLRLYQELSAVVS